MLVLLGVLAGCQEVEDEVSVRTENVGFAAEQTEKVEVNVKAAEPAGEPAGEPAKNPINLSTRTGIAPESLKIPAIGVDTSVQHLGTTETGEMAVPDNIDEVSWFSPGYQPGQNGRAVIAGHVDGVDGPAVFWDLSELQPGDEITVEGEGRQLIYKVHTMESVPLDQADIPKIFGYSSSPELVLITCSGTYDFDRGTREERLVVYASYAGE
ncbi:class F sortase [Planococcus sp. APC 3906]|uniref:class F sortase n=1 Tax=Planococcus sp. APC 3906 TaxID=3035194 RepID=UPI0025B5F22C|nr:class F sortase [Planococcus sp. APC 3906]MDN3450499.1 class F sortase [Planococcus sp. APC 3906]